jgi:phosphatidylglycerophosphate synthase
MSAGTVGWKANTEFKAARRMHVALTASAEKKALQWMAERMPAWVTSDQLTVLGFAAQVGAGVAYGLARYRHQWLWAVIVCVVLNWFGDSMDGTLARVRAQQRPRYGFYVDHVVDVLGATAMMCGLGLSGLVHGAVAAAMLVAFLLLASESYLAAYTLGRFEMSQGVFGPTEIRLLLIAGNLALLRSPWAHVFGHRWLLFDVGGVIAVIGMFAMLLAVTVRHTLQLFREEPLP